MKDRKKDNMTLKTIFLFYLIIVQIVLCAGCLIKGRVVDQNGAGVAGVTITLSGDASMTAMTDGNGGYQFGTLGSLLTAGNYTVTPSYSEAPIKPASKNVTISNVPLDNGDVVPWPVAGVDFTAEKTVRYWGVFVGISDYQALDDLYFASDDAISVYNLFLQDSLWDDSRMTLLVNSQATRAAVQNAIEAMASNADEDDICLVFFSGHGGQADDDFLPYDESDGRDEYICLWDSTVYDYSGDFVDDDFGDTLGLIKGKAVVLIDACFSGGSFKAKAADKNWNIEKIGTKRSIKFAKKPFEQGTGAAKTGDGFTTDLIGRTGVKDVDQSNIIILTACDDDERSSEDINFRHGAFTYFLILSLKSNDENGNGYVCAEEAFEYLGPALTDYSRSTVHPQFYDSSSGEIDLLRATVERLVFIGHGDFSWVYPFNTYWKKRRAEYIYSQSQLGGQGYITGLKIFVETKPSIPLNNCTVRMQHTSQNSYSSAPEWTSSGWTTVYSGTKTIDNEGAVSFELSEPFLYDGYNNLIIDFSFSNQYWIDGADDSFYGSYAENTYPMIYYEWDDDNFGPPTTWSGASPQPTRDENDPYGSYLDLELEFSTSAP